MKKWLIALCLTLVVLTMTACNAATATPDATDEVIGTINGEDVYRYEYDFYFNTYFDEYFTNYYDTLKYSQGVDLLDEESSHDLLGNLESYCWDSVVKAVLIRQMAAEDYNLTLEPNYTDELLLPSYSLSLKTNRLYSQMYTLIQEEAAQAQRMSEDDARAAYEADTAAWDSRQVAHIIILPADESEEAMAEAKAQTEDIIAQLDEGADFAEMAVQYSQDGSAAAGGAMDLYFNRAGGGVSESTTFDAAFAAGAFELENIGDYSAAPVESSFGYHIIKLLDEKKDFESVKDYIIASSETVSEEEAAAYFKQKLDEKQAAAAIERTMQFKYYEDLAAGTTEEAAGEDVAGDEAVGEDAAGEETAQ